MKKTYATLKRKQIKKHIVWVFIQQATLHETISSPYCIWSFDMHSFRQFSKQPKAHLQEKTIRLARVSDIKLAKICK